MEILLKVPEEIKWSIIEKCPLAYQFYLEKLIFKRETKLRKKLKELGIFDCGTTFTDRLEKCFARIKHLDSNEYTFFVKFNELDLRFAKTTPVIQWKRAKSRHQREWVRNKTKLSKGRLGLPHQICEIIEIQQEYSRGRKERQKFLEFLFCLHNFFFHFREERGAQCADAKLSSNLINRDIC